MKKIHYGWFIVAAGVLLYFCGCGLTSTSLSVYLPYLKEHCRLTNTATSLITTIRCLSSFLVSFFAIRYYRRVSIRIGATLILSLTAVSFVILAFAKSALTCYAAAVIFGIVYGLGAAIPTSLLINDWFITKMGLALGVSACGSGIASTVVPLIAETLIRHFSLRVTFLFMAALALVCTLLVFLLIRNKPKDIGAEPYDKGGRKMQRVAKDNPQMPNSSFVIMCIAILSIGMVSISSPAHQGIYYRTAGYDEITAAAALSVFGLTLTIGKCIFGLVRDRIGTFRTNYVFFALLIAGHALAFAANTINVSLLYTASALMGLGLSIPSIGNTLWAEELSSHEMFPYVLQRFQIVYVLGSLVGSPIPGMIADATGTYATSFAGFALLSLLALTFIQFCYIQKKRRTGNECSRHDIV